MRNIILHMVLLLIVAAKTGHAQNGLYIPPQANIAVLGKDTLGIFCNVRNDGRFGSVKGTVINFYGSKWENGNDALLPDENDYNNTTLRNTGGIFRFLQQKGTNMGAQYIYGGYSAGANAGASFPNLGIANKNGLQLEDLSDLKVRHTLHFEEGHVLLNGWNLVVGERYPGNITGYSEKSFVVTGTEPGGGFLYREQIGTSDSMVVFPLGASTDSYSPMALTNNSGAPHGMHARVFDSVYQQAITGAAYTEDYVLKTWNIGGDAVMGHDMTVWLQYNRQQEGSAFSLGRDSSFVARYMAATGWDTLPAQEGITAGRLTSGAPLPNAYMNKRLFSGGLDANNFLSVTVPGKHGISSDVELFFEAYRQSRRWVNTRWHTTKERNLLRYELQRRRENEDSFYTVSRIAPRSFNGSSQGNSYTYSDDNLYDNWTYYRLKVVGKDGKIFYSPVKPVPWLIEITVGPNPNNGNFRVTTYGIKHQLMMVMRDMAGRPHGNWTITGDTNITNSGLPAGMYLLTFYDKENNNAVVNTIKIEILQ